MKKIILMLILFLMVACGGWAADNGATMTDVKKTDSSTLTTTKKDTITTAAVISKADVYKRMLGMWVADGQENVTFEIDEKEFFYPEQSSSFKYQVFGDSIKIKYDGFDQSFAVRMKDGDILRLTGIDGESTYKRAVK